MLENILTSAIKTNYKKYFRRLIAESSQTLGNEQESSSLIRNPGLIPGNKGKKYLLYIHIPFCEKLCPYCSFNRYEFEPGLVRRYFSALRREIEIYHNYGYDFDSAYIGGGTPTIMPDELFKTLGLIKQIYSVKEISIETNPNHLTSENLKILKEMKINRLSVGVQSFNDRILKAINRYEPYGSGQETKERLKGARDKSYTLNVDMIFNFPSQNVPMLEQDIDSLIEVNPDQVTFYPLMPSNAVSSTLSYGLGKINYKQEKQFYFKILDRLSVYWQPLTVWCFGKKRDLADEYIINRDEYIGLGSGSFGLLNGYVYANTFLPAQYIKSLSENKLPVAFSKRFSQQELARYGFLMQLFGINLDIEKFNNKYSQNPLKFMRKELVFLGIAGGITRKNGSISLTRRGMYYWVIAMREFFISVNNFRQHCRNTSYN